MDLVTLTLDQFSPRALNLLGSIFGGADVRVVVSGRASHPATVVLNSRTVVLDPTRVWLYDLALCARLLKHRGLRYAVPGRSSRHDRWLTRKAHRDLVSEVHRELHREYPGIGRLPGRYRPGADLKGLRVVRKSVCWKPLPKLPPPPTTLGLSPRVVPLNRPWSPSSFEFAQIPELEIRGAEDDFAWLLDALANGYFPLQAIPTLPELPFLRVPFRLCLGEALPTMELIEEHLAQPENKELIEGLMGCYRRKSEVRQKLFYQGRFTLDGIRLDTNRLVEAVMARRVGLQPRLFRERTATIQPVFDPAEHLAVLAFDINDLRRQETWFSDDPHEAIHRFLACLITFFQRLEIDLVIIGFADQLFRLPTPVTLPASPRQVEQIEGDGMNHYICLHFQIVLKQFDEPCDEAFWNRLVRLMIDPPRFPGERTCFHPLSLRDITGFFDRIAWEQDHSYRSVVWWARRGMKRGFPQFRDPDFLMRVADHVDSEILNLERRLTGILDTVASYLPQELKDHGRPGQYLQGIQIS